MSLTKKQREALAKVRAGSVQYGMRYPNMARRTGFYASMPTWVVDDIPIDGRKANTYTSLEERGLIVVRYDLLPKKMVPEQEKKVRTISGFMEPKTLPAHEEPEDPGWRAVVEIATEEIKA